MGFLHLGWESATFEDDGLAKPLADLSPQWAAVAQVCAAVAAAAPGRHAPQSSRCRGRTRG